MVQVGTSGTVSGFLLKKDGHTQQHLHLKGRLAQQRPHVSSQGDGLGSSVGPVTASNGDARTNKSQHKHPLFY